MSEETSLNIKFNKEVIDRVKQSNIQLDLMGTVLFVLVGLSEDRLDLLEYADDSNKQRRMIVLYRQLEHRGLLERTTVGKSLYRLTPKGEELVSHVKQQCDEDIVFTFVHTEEEPTQAEAADASDPIRDWIEQWVNIFPDNNGEGRRLRTHPAHLVAKMRKFIEKYKFDKDTILKATKSYISTQEQGNDGHKYTRTANYFINKGMGSTYTSDLADWCQRVVDGTAETAGPDTRMMDMC